MAFLEKKLEYNLSIPAINLINYKKKGVTEAFTFALSMFNKSSIISNMSVFKDLNIK